VLSDIPAHAELGFGALVSAGADDTEVAGVLTQALRDNGSVPNADGIASWDDVADQLVAIYDEARCLT
jgi:hypothetical protein